MAILDTSTVCMKRVNPGGARFGRSGPSGRVHIWFRFLLWKMVVPLVWWAFGPNSYKNPRDYLEAGSCRKKLPRNNKKFMQTLETETFHMISKEASQRGATVQELLRAVIIPEWLSENRRKWIK